MRYVTTLGMNSPALPRIRCLSHRVHSSVAVAYT